MIARWLSRDRPDRPLLVQMRDLWRVPPDWTHRPTWRVHVRLTLQQQADRILRRVA